MRIGMHGSDRGYGQYKKNYTDMEGGVQSRGKGDVEEGSPEVSSTNEKARKQLVHVSLPYLRRLCCLSDSAIEKCAPLVF